MSPQKVLTENRDWRILVGDYPDHASNLFCFPARFLQGDLRQVRALVRIILMMVGLSGGSPAGAAGSTRVFDLVPGGASETLKQFAVQAQREIMFPAEAVAGLTTRAVKGTFDPAVALAGMIAGTSLTFVEDTQTGAFIVKPALPPHSLPTSVPASAASPTSSAAVTNPMIRKNPLSVLAAWLGLALATPAAVAAADSASLTGIVSNAATGNLLEGARVELPSLGRSQLTDSTGRFVFMDVPAGSLLIRASYLGLDTMRHEVMVGSGQRVVRNFDLTSAIYQLAEFKVTGEREGAAAAITEKRNAVNVKDVVAMDQFGNLPNLGTGEVVMRLPGVAGSWGWVRARTLSTVAQQVADPVGAAARDYAGNFRELSGKYAKWFPSVHALHDFTPNLKAHLSWSTSFGRAGLNEFLPAETPNEANRFVTINNPGLKPQTASNWDATLEYYFEPVGSVSVGWFHKTIKDYILRGQEVALIGSGADNGYNGEYGGWSERTSINAGTAVAQGWEFAYQQQFTFLPGLLKGLAASANYTRLVTHGDYGGTTYLTSRDVAGFIPHSANASLSWRYRKFNTRVLYNFTGEHVQTYNVASPALSVYRQSNKTVNVGFGYQLRPAVTLSLGVANIFNEPQILYRAFKDRTQRTIYNFVTVTAGVNGRF